MGGSHSWAVSQLLPASQTLTPLPPDTERLQCLSPSTFLYVHESAPLPMAPPPTSVIASHLGPCSSPSPHLTVVLPRFALCHLVGELCLLVAHRSEAVEAVADLWKGLNTVASFPWVKGPRRLSPPPYAAYLDRCRGHLTSDQVLGYQ